MFQVYGTFSVSALGMYGVDMFTPVINPPNVGIMGVGRLRNELVLRDGRWQDADATPVERSGRAPDAV